jgi:hypothetical protein
VSSPDVPYRYSPGTWWLGVPLVVSGPWVAWWGYLRCRVFLVVLGGGTKRKASCVDEVAGRLQRQRLAQCAHRAVVDRTCRRGQR